MNLNYNTKIVSSADQGIRFLIGIPLCWLVISILHRLTYQLGIFFQDASIYLAEYIHHFHDWLIVVSLSIGFLTLSSLYMVQNTTYSGRTYTESQSLEFLWTLTPALVLGAIVLPSLRLLYLYEGEHGPSITVKVLGHQWYWQYDYAELPPYDSYMARSGYRLLDTDNRLLIPNKCWAQLLISAADVLHSWTVPSFAVKADAVPGRVNKIALLSKRPGLYFGQCREICGRNHRYIPISVECFL